MLVVYSAATEASIVKINTQESNLRGSRMDPPVATAGSMVGSTASGPRLEMVDGT